MNTCSASDVLSDQVGIPAKDVLAYQSAGVVTVADLLERLPKRFEDRRRFDSFPLQAGAGALCLRGTVIDSRVRRFGGRKQYYEAIIVEAGDGILTTSKVTCRWFNMPWMKNTLAAGHEIVLYGKPKEYQGGIFIDHPDFEIVEDDSDESIHLERIVPIYKGISGVTQRRQRIYAYELLRAVNPDSLAPIYDGVSYIIMQHYPNDILRKS